MESVFPRKGGPLGTRPGLFLEAFQALCRDAYGRAARSQLRAGSRERPEQNRAGDAARAGASPYPRRKESGAPDLPYRAASTSGVRHAAKLTFLLACARRRVSGKPAKACGVSARDIG